MDYNKLLIRTIFSIIIFALFFAFYLYYPKYIILLVIFIYLIIIYEVFKNFNYYNFLVYFYLIISFLILTYFLLYLYNQNIFLIFVLTVLLFDTFSYLFGKIFGKIKFIPSISPNKTLEGFIGGFISTLFFILSYNYLIKKYFILELVIFSSLIILLAFLGDLLQSYIKRKSKIKDSSNFLPGHGGFFDRMDGYLLSVFILPLHSFFL